MNKQIHRWMIGAAAVLLGSSATAAVVTYTGTTAGGPTFNRPLEDLSSPSGVGTAVRYDTRTFTVSQTGSYDFVLTGAYDTFLFVYSPTFNPATPLTNALVGNDDAIMGYFNTSAATLNLTAGTSYVALATGFANTDFGSYSMSIGGSGIISPIVSTPVSSTVFTRLGDTTGGPTYNRPLEDGSALSGVGTAVRYDAFGFTVSQTGDYTLAETAGFDTFLSLYGSSFNPASPLANLVQANDDLLPSGFNSSGIGATLTAGVNYYAVSSGFSNNDFGAFSLQIGGVGSVNPLNATGGTGGAVPEPASWAMMAGGFGLIGSALRRRTRVRSATAAA